MSIEAPTERFLEIARATQCFECGKAIGSEVPHFVYWFGLSRQEIMFHPDCALAFSLKFGRDLWELDLYGRTRATYEG